MFETEAEEYASTGRLSKSTHFFGVKAISFKDGAEFGYQEGLKAKINATTISDCPIKDEWHRLGKNPNDLPDEDVPVLCVRGSNIYVAWYSNNEWRGTRWEQVKKPYAWKEIELPKEKE
ncbi:MAG: hypothetical protein J6V90_08280 [Treponema sp.]|nr:hypothetical protein [Treponema sp.]